MVSANPRKGTATGLLLLAIAISGCGQGPMVRPGGQYEATTAGTTKRLWPHRGVDYAKPTGTTIIAPAEGKVTGVSIESRSMQRFNCGKGVGIWRTGPARKVSTRICHMQRTYVEVGEIVEQGQPIGTVGTSGCKATGCDPHVHFEVQYDYRLVKRDSNPADPYMTAVTYFNALRELGSARRIVEDEINVRLQSYAERNRAEESRPRFANRRIFFEPVELTSRVSTAEVAEAKRKLALSFRRADRVDVALATNMISVGLDIIRLGLMVVSGQPKTTSEYIQATSRVGRDPGRPGLVVALLNVHNPRDRSHYERFSSYHESFYRSVEATSVTPFSPRALDRGLAAVTVGLARLGIRELTPIPAARDVGEYEVETARIARAIGERAATHSDTATPELGEEVARRARSLLDDWAKLAHGPKERGVPFGYRSGKNVSVPLLREMIDPKRAPEVFYDPRSLAASETTRSALHAKCIVVDGQKALVTSANFTEAAQERNIELGLLLHSGPVAERIERQLQGLIERKHFKRLAISEERRLPA